MVFTLAHVVQRFERRRGGSQNNGNLLAVCAVDGQIAGVIAPAFLLFIGAVVLFVDHDNAKIFKRREQRRAGADYNRRFAVFRFQPGAESLAVIQAGVQNLNRRVKAFAESGDGLRRQANFRHHHQRLFALREHVFQHAQVNFGLAGTGDPSQQPGRETIGGAMNCAYRGGLLGIQTQAIP